MQDEHFMQGWNEGHRRFSADLDRGLSHLADRLSRPGKARKAIRKPYGSPADPALTPGAQASLRGLAATGLTVLLWVVVLSLATPAPGLAASAQLALETCACLTHPPLA